jgi:hypothetical protein
VAGGGAAAVRTEIDALWPELPAAVDADTEIENAVFAASPPTVAAVAAVVWFCAPFTMIRYVIEQPGALDALHERLTLLEVWPGELSPVGVVGTLVHAAVPWVATEIAALAAEALPA